jgi:diacylglycerol kinase family enzyme
VEYLKSASVRIESGRALDVYADGEYVCGTPVEISLVARALKVIMPEGCPALARKVP